MRQLTYIKKTVQRGDIQSINSLQAHLTLFRLALSTPDQSKKAGVLGLTPLELLDESVEVHEGVLQVALDGMWSALDELEGSGEGYAVTSLVYDVRLALGKLGSVTELLINPTHRENVERLVLPSLQVLINSILVPLSKTVKVNWISKSTARPKGGKRRWLGIRRFKMFKPSRLDIFRTLNKLGQYTAKSPVDSFSVSLLDGADVPSPSRDRVTAHMTQYVVSGYSFLRYMASVRFRHLWRRRRRVMIFKRTKRRRWLRRRRRLLRRTYRIARQRRQWARRWKQQRLMPYRRWLRNRGGSHTSLGYLRSLLRSGAFRYWRPTALRRRIFVIRSTIMPRRRLRVPTVVWWRRFIRWHNYWLTSRKRKPQKRYKPLREAKRFMFKRLRKWPMARVHQVHAGLYRNPSRGKWWLRGSIFPRKYRRKRISKYAKLLRWRNSTFKTARGEAQRRRASFYIRRMQSNRSNYLALSQLQFDQLGMRFEKAKFSNVPEDKLNELIRVKKKAFFLSRTAKYSQRRFLRRLRYFLPRWKKRRLKFFRRKIPQIFGYFRLFKQKYSARY